MIRDLYNVPILATLVILGAETSLGDPKLGGTLAKRHNPGCIKASAKGPWQYTADGTVVVRNQEWWTWPDALMGMDAWGQYISERFDGRYLELIAEDDWRGLASIYYGKTVYGFENYADDLEWRVKNVRAKALQAGYEW